MFFDTDGKGNPIDCRHVDIKQCQIGAVCLQPVKCFYGTTKAFHLFKLRQFPDQRQTELQHERFIIHTDCRHSVSFLYGSRMVTVQPAPGLLSMLSVPPQSISTRPLTFLIPI